MTRFSVKVKMSEARTKSTKTNYENRSKEDLEMKAMKDFLGEHAIRNIVRVFAIILIATVAVITYKTVGAEDAGENKAASTAIVGNPIAEIESIMVDTEEFLIVEFDTINVALSSNTATPVVYASPATVNVVSADAAEDTADEQVSKETADEQVSEGAADQTQDSEEQTQEVTEAATESVIHYGVVAYTDDDYYNLVRIIAAEATGADVMSKMMVGRVVINRVLNARFPSTITEVIYQGNGEQFTPIKDGRFWSVTPSADDYEAANRVLAGEDYAQGALYFAAVSSVTSGSWHSTLNRLFEYYGHIYFN